MGPVNRMMRNATESVVLPNVTGSKKLAKIGIVRENHTGANELLRSKRFPEVARSMYDTDDHENLPFQALRYDIVADGSGVRIDFRNTVADTLDVRVGRTRDAIVHGSDFRNSARRCVLE